jgi:hypothetical protein
LIYLLSSFPAFLQIHDELILEVDARQVDVAWVVQVRDTQGGPCLAGRAGPGASSAIT